MSKNDGEASVEELVTVKMPTAYGDFLLSAFDFKDHCEPALALTCGDISGKCDVPVRIHSSCMTGDIFGSERCDCGPQLKFAMKLIAANGFGMIIYLHQEGRGIGLLKKLRAYRLQEQGLDTIEANLALGLPVDCREYSTAVAILRHLSVKSVQLMTNNPTKRICLEGGGIKVSSVIPVEIEPNANNLDYLSTKANRMGHALPGLIRN